MPVPRLSVRTAAYAATLAVCLALATACGSEGSPAASSSTPTPSPDSADSPASSSPSAAAPGTVALSDDDGLGVAREYWATRMGDGWEPVVVEQGGRNQLKNPETGCLLTTVQTETPPTSGTDATLSRRVLQTQAGALAREAGDLGRVVVKGGGIVPGSEPSVEMAAARVDYTRKDTGQKSTSFFVTRDFSGNDTLLLAVLNCATSRLPSTDAAMTMLNARANVTTQ